MTHEVCPPLIIDDDQNFLSGDQPGTRNAEVNSSINYIHGLQDKFRLASGNSVYKREQMASGISDTEAPANNNCYHLLADKEHRLEATHACPGTLKPIESASLPVV